MNLKECLKERLLVKISPDKNKAASSLKIALSKLSEAKRLFEQEFFDNAIITAYTSMFHAARALLYKEGFQEKSHYAVYIFLEEKYSDKLPKNLIDVFYYYQKNRHNILYGLEDYHVSAEKAETAVIDAEDFLNKIKEIL